MTSNAPITDKLRQYISEKLKGVWPAAPVVDTERRAECPLTVDDTQKERAPRVRVKKTCAIGVHTVEQAAPRRTGGAKLASLKVQPTGIISPVPYPKWKLDEEGEIIPSVCTRKGNGLGNRKMSVTYSGGTHTEKDGKVIGFGTRQVVYKEEATKAKYIAKAHKPRKNYEVEQVATVIVTPDERAKHLLAVKQAIRAAATDAAIKKELSTKAAHTPKWSGPTGGEATTPRRDEKPVVKAPKIFNGRSKKTKNKPKKAKKLFLAALSAKKVTKLDVLDRRNTAEEKAVEKMLRLETVAYEMNRKKDAHAAKKKEVA